MIGKIYFSNKKNKKSNKIYGVKRQISNSSTAWERIEEAVGLVANATKDGSSVQNDFDNIYPWSDIISCDVSADGTINSYYGQPGFSFTNPKGYIMTLFPEFYWKREQSGGYEYIYISATEHNGFSKSESFMLGRYTASGSSSAITTKSGVVDLVSISITNFRTAAKKVGTNWGQLDIKRWSMLQLLYLVEYADYNSQSMLGYGNCNTSAKINSGSCDSLGMKSGCLSNDKAHSVIYRGIENIFGNISQWVDGINFTDSQAWVCDNPSDYVSDKFASPYEKLGYVNVGGGYISKVGYDSSHSEIQMSSQVSGSSSTYIPDYAGSNSGSRVLYVGGYYSSDLGCGLWCAYWSGTSSGTDTFVGGRLLFIPV
jgi:hypothetical protein